MKKITCNINSPKKVIKMSTGHLSTEDFCMIEIERVSIVFKYHNIPKKTDLLWYGLNPPGTRIVAEPGYYTITNIQKKLEPAGVTLTTTMDGKCVLKTGKMLYSTFPKPCPNSLASLTQGSRRTQLPP